MPKRIFSIDWSYKKSTVEGRQIRLADDAAQALAGFREEMKSYLRQAEQGGEVDLSQLNTDVDQVFDGLDRGDIIRALRGASSEDLIGILKEVFQ